MINFLFKYKTVANEKAYFKTGKYAEPYVSQIDEIAGGGGNYPYGVHFNRLLIISPETNEPLVTILRSNTTSRGWLDTTATTNVYLDNVSGVTSFPDIFKGNTTLTSFDEFQWWYSLKTSPSFSGCTKLETLKTPAGLTAIPSGWLDGKPGGSLKRLNSDIDGVVILPKKVNAYGAASNNVGYCFNFQRNMKKLYVPEGITVYGREVLGCCSGLEEIYSYVKTSPAINGAAWSFTFDNNGGWTKDTKIYYPKGGWGWINKYFSTPIACDLDEYGRLIIPKN